MYLETNPVALPEEQLCTLNQSAKDIRKKAWKAGMTHPKQHMPARKGVAHATGNRISAFVEMGGNCNRKRISSKRAVNCCGVYYSTCNIATPSSTSNPIVYRDSRVRLKTKSKPTLESVPRKRIWCKTAESAIKR